MSKFQVGDWVRVRKPASWRGRLPLKATDVFDGSCRAIKEVLESGLFKLECAEDYTFHPDWLQLVSRPSSQQRSWVPEGHTVIPIAVPDDMANQLCADSGTVLVWKPPKLGMNYLCPTTSHVRCATEDFSECYPTATSTTVPAEQYREPTAADVGRMVEVRGSEKDWKSRELLAVIVDKNVEQRFVCRDRNSERKSLNWKYARIKITPDTP